MSILVSNFTVNPKISSMQYWSPWKSPQSKRPNERAVRTVHTYDILVTKCDRTPDLSTLEKRVGSPLIHYVKSDRDVVEQDCSYEVI